MAAVMGGDIAFSTHCPGGVCLARRNTVRPRVTEALGYIPPAAFAALVANDLISPGAFDAGLWQGLIPWIAAAGVVAVAIKTKSMLWCCVSGIVFYIVLSFI
ncbi:MAG: AzlD domain-containing protein [Collinsella sp.]